MSEKNGLTFSKAMRAVLKEALSENNSTNLCDVNEAILDKCVKEDGSVNKILTLNDVKTSGDMEINLLKFRTLLDEEAYSVRD